MPAVAAASAAWTGHVVHPLQQHTWQQHAQLQLLLHLLQKGLGHGWQGAMKQEILAAATHQGDPACQTAELLLNIRAGLQEWQQCCAVVSNRLPDAAGHVGRRLHTAEPSRVVV